MSSSSGTRVPTKSTRVSASLTDEPYSFPFPPYEIQIGLMDHMVDVLDGTLGSRARDAPASVALLESPTGTGKSLSLICGALSWLIQHGSRAGAEKAVARSSSSSSSSSGSSSSSSSGKTTTRKLPSWVTSHAASKTSKEQAGMVKDMDKQETQLRAALQGAVARMASHEAFDGALEGDRSSRKRAKLGSAASDPGAAAGTAAVGSSSSSSSSSSKASISVSLDEDDTHLVMAFPPSSDAARVLGQGGGRGGAGTGPGGGRGRRVGDEDQPVVLGGVDVSALAETTKVYYASRTHSQISQFVHELRDTAFVKEKALRVVALGSRSTLCINPSVNKAGTPGALINDRCRDLREAKPATASSSSSSSSSGKRKRRGGCAYYQPVHVDADDATASFPLYGLTEPRAIEELAHLGRRLGACPYYGSRRSVSAAHIVALPYSMLVHGPTRESLGIDLDGAVVIVDEAHNLVDAIASVHSVTVTKAGVDKASMQLNAYYERYSTRLSSYNRDCVLDLLNVVSAFQAYFEAAEASGGAGPGVKRVLQVNTFLHDAALSIDHVNPHILRDYVDASQLINKLIGFARDARAAAAAAAAAAAVNGNDDDDDVAGKDKGDAAAGVHDSPLRDVLGFLEAVNDPLAGANGRVVLTSSAKTGALSLKYLVLNPAAYFEPVRGSARAIFLAGGTMRPYDETLAALLGEVPQMGRASEAGRVSVYSCGHVVDASRLVTVAVGVSPLDAGTRLKVTYGNRGKLIPHLRAALGNIANVAPGGMVVFFPSYAYEEAVMGSGQGAVTRKKPLFREKAGLSSETVLAQYSATVKANGKAGAMLSCVMGGKMSEGINFSDELGRVVVVVGAPYPPPDDPELKARLGFASRVSGTGSTHAAMATMTMKTVNQCVGRAIRHINDYAAIVLLDVRYIESALLRDRLPEWIMRNAVAVPPGGSFGPTVRALAQFFKRLKPSDGSASASASARV